MTDLAGIATVELARFLSDKMPALAADWWDTRVVRCLSYQQQMLHDRGARTLNQLDLAALLRVLDQNWHDLSGAVRLPREGRSWVKELQAARNRWAHHPAEATPAGDVYRDADTLARLLAMVDAQPASREAVEAVKARAVATMAASGSRPAPATSAPPTPASPPGDSPEPRALAPSRVRGAVPAGHGATYAPLARFLAGSSRREERLDFARVEEILGRPLPASARNHRPWWGNHASSVQAAAWMGAGWKVGGVDLAREDVTFVRAN